MRKLIVILLVVCAALTTRSAFAQDVPQRAVLYDEDPNNKSGKQYVGQVIWRKLDMTDRNGVAETIVRAEIQVPDRLKAQITWRKNADAALPASHTFEITFQPASGVRVDNMPDILMRSGESASKYPAMTLAGLAVKIRDNSFLVGLSNVEADRVKNLELLRERPRFELPIVYGDKLRSILALEKGPTGEKVFSEALATWAK